MSGKLRVLLLTCGLLAVLALAACSGADKIPDPESYCLEQGGTLEDREGVEMDYQMCMFADGSECGKWAFYKGECAQGSSLLEVQSAAENNRAIQYCEGLGFEIEVHYDAMAAREWCVFTDGTSCNAWEFLSGSCKPQFTYCKQNGGSLISNWGSATCILEDGTRCSEFKYFTGECGPSSEDG